MTSVQTVDRAFDLIEYLAEHGDSRLAEISAELGVPRATIFRLLSTLQARGYVEHVRSAARYRLGSRFAQVASVAGRSVVLELAEPEMNELRKQTGETVNLALVRQGRILYLLVLEGPLVPRMSATVGHEVPVHSTALGKAILSVMPTSRRDALLPAEPYTAWTSKTITDRAALDQELDATAERGYAIDDGEMDVGAVCLAAPIFAGSGEVIGAVSVAGLEARISLADREKIGTAVRTSCVRLSAALGYTPGSDGHATEEVVLQ